MLKMFQSGLPIELHSNPTHFTCCTALLSAQTGLLLWEKMQINIISTSNHPDRNRSTINTERQQRPLGKPVKGLMAEVVTLFEGLLTEVRQAMTNPTCSPAWSMSTQTTHTGSASPLRLITISLGKN